MPLISASHFTPGPSSFLGPREPSLLESPWLLSLPLLLRGRTHPLVPTFFLCQARDPTSGIRPQHRKSPGPVPCVGLRLRQAVGVGQGFLHAPTPATQGPAQNRWPFISLALIWGPQQVTEPWPPSLPAEPSSGMGNCLRPADSFPDDNSSYLSFEDEQLEGWNYSSESYDYSGMDAAAPCRSCTLLGASSLPFYILASVLGILASAAILFALLGGPLSPRQLCPSRRLLLAQLAVGSALFSVAVPILAPGLQGAHNTYLCHLARLVWNGSAFAQALLISCHACLGPTLGAGPVPRLVLGLSVGLWKLAILLAVPVTLASDTSDGHCSLASSQGVLKLLHGASLLAIFVLLPLGLLGARGLTRALGRGPCPWVDVLWLWFLFWWPHGVLWGLDALVRSRVLVLSSCPAQQALDLLLPLAEVLAILHCVAGPLLLAAFCHRAARGALPSSPLPASQPSPPDALGGKSQLRSSLPA